jgi:hypothetical protein
VATDEPVEPYVAPRTTRASIKKVSQTQARNLKRAKKAKEAEVSLEAHASTVSSDDVSDYFSLLSFHALLLLYSSFGRLWSRDVTTQDFIKFWGKIFVFILLVLIENSQGFKTFEFI